MDIKVYSRDAIEELLQSDGLIQEGILDNVAVISFYDPPNKRTGEVYEPVDYAGKVDRVFPIAIHDIDIEILEDYGLTFDTYFPEVDDLAEFVIKAIQECKTIICQCEYGQSRSAACAAAIKEYIDHTGIEIFSNYKYYPNQLVYNKVLTALKNKTPYVSRHYQDIVVTFDEYELQLQALEHQNTLLYLLCTGKNYDKYELDIYAVAQQFEFIGSLVYKSYGDTLKREPEQYYYERLFNTYHETVEETAEQLYMVRGEKVTYDYAVQIHKLLHFCAMCICKYLADREVWWVETYMAIIEYALDHADEILENNYRDIPDDLRQSIAKLDAYEIKYRMKSPKRNNF